MFRKRRLTNPGASGSSSNPSRSKKQRIADVVKITLDIAKETSDWFPPLKSALGGVTALIKHYEEFEGVKEKIEGLKPQLDRLKRNLAATTVGGDPGETRRRIELTSALEGIEKRSRELLAKSTASRFVDKGEDSKEVAGFIEHIRDAITHYQMSQQQAIYDRITDLTSSFGTLLKLHEKSPAVKSKLDSVRARLDRLCSEDNDDALCDENEHERWTKLFETLRLIRDDGNTLYNRINIQGYEECQSDILAASGMAEDIRDALLEYQTIHQRVIYEQNCRLIDAADLSVLNNCRRAPGAGYQHGDRKGCLRGTRETVLNEIELWAADFKKSPVFWLNGLAGTGKSTIAQTVSERAFADGILGASFFCSRDFKDRNNLHFIFPTLAFQLAHKYPKFRSVLVPLLQLNPDVVHESLYSQMGKLIVEPLVSADVSTVIVIDALDECEDGESASVILSVLGRLVEQVPKVKFFITGRPEPRIKTGFRLPLLVDVTNVFVLHDVHPSLINNDIRLFFKHELSELSRRRRVDGWPNVEHIDLLCRRAAGLFVYAVATVKFLDSNNHLPKRRLDVILGLPECTVPEGTTWFKPKTTLDSLYASILEAAFVGGDSGVYSKVRSTIGAVVLLDNPLPPPGISEITGIDFEEVKMFLGSVQSLLTLDEDFSQPVKPFHNSFPDFITNPSRCTDARFYISPGSLHLELVTNCLRLMNSGLQQNLLSLPDYALNLEVGDLQTRIKDCISVALRYSCQAWHSHLIKAAGDTTGVVSDLRFFLKEKFLAWLEVVSVLGAARGAVAALEQLMSWLQKVAKDEEILKTARDCFYFLTRFFEVINISATHIYHSALELSPLQSTIRRLHYCRVAPSPRVVIGTPDSWEQSIGISNEDRPYGSCAWSSCGQFVAAQTQEFAEVRDPLTFELLSTLQPVKPTPQLMGPRAYSPDGRSLCCVSDTTIIIWDIQTGGVAKEIERGAALHGSLVWSSDGRTIGAILRENSVWAVVVYDAVSGTTLSYATLSPVDEPYLWTHDKSFRVTTTAWENKSCCTIDTFEVGSALTKVESYPIRVQEGNLRIKSFSSTSYRVSVSVSVKNGQLLVLDIRNSEHLLWKSGEFGSHCFSSDGDLFAASLQGGVHIWKHTFGCYTPWREFQDQGWSSYNLRLQFSPSSSSFLGHFGDILRVWRLDGSPGPLVADRESYHIFSPYGTYTVTAHRQKSTITITNLHSRAPSQFIDVGLKVGGLALTGNVLSVVGISPSPGETTTWGVMEEEEDLVAIVAWRLTEEGVVHGVFGHRSADSGDSVWTIPLARRVTPKFSIRGQVGFIAQTRIIHVYHAGTGEEFEHIPEPRQLPDRWYDLEDLSRGRYHLPYHGSSQRDGPSEDGWQISRTSLREGWVKDLEGNHRLWVPAEWRVTGGVVKWFHSISTLQFELTEGELIIVRF